MATNVLTVIVLASIGFALGRYIGAAGLVIIYGLWVWGYLPLYRQKLATQPQLPDDKNIARAYQVLGVSRQADKNTIDQARKHLLNHYHPDKLSAASTLEKQAAENKFNEINRAYRLVCEHRRLS